MILTALSVEKLHSLCLDIQTDIQHCLFGLVMPLASAMHDTYGIKMACDTDASTTTGACKKAYSTLIHSSEHDKCSTVIDGTISIMSEETCFCHVCAKM